VCRGSVFIRPPVAERGLIPRLKCEAQNRPRKIFRRDNKTLTAMVRPHAAATGGKCQISRYGIGLQRCSAEPPHRVNANGQWRDARQSRHRCQRPRRFNDGKFAVLIEATFKPPQTPPGSLAWINGAVEGPLIPNGKATSVATLDGRDLPARTRRFGNVAWLCPEPE
jgi:hypothetical protein